MRYPLQQSNGTWGADNESWNVEVPRKLADESKKAEVPSKLSICAEPVEACVHSLIKRAAWERPSAPAICSWDGNLTYQQLDQASSRLAHKLVDIGVEPRTKVVLCFEKTWLAPLSMLALMKAGVASISLDIRQSIYQLQAITATVSASVFLSSSANENLAWELGAAKVVVVNNEMLSNPITTSWLPQKLATVTPSDVLCEVFDPDCDTGAIFTHGDFSSAITYQQRALGFTHSSRVLDLESYASRTAWFSFLTLTCGGCLCIPSQVDLQDDIDGCISRLRANYALLPPKSVWALDYSKLSLSVRLKHIDNLVLLSSIDYLECGVNLVDPYGSSKAGLPALIDLRSNNGRKSNGYISNGPTPNGVATNGHTIKGQGLNGYMPNGRAANGHTTNKHSLNGDGTDEFHVEHPPWDDWVEGLVVDQSPKTNNRTEDPVQNKQGEPLVSLKHNEQIEAHCKHHEFSDCANGLICTVQANTKLRENDLRGQAITPFSLLGQCTSIDKEEVRTFAARLCQVRESQVVDVMPCTPLQEGLLALTTKRAGDYVARNVFEIGRDIDIERFHWAWDQTVARNPILRTRIISVPDLGIMQVVLKEGAQWTLGADVNGYQVENSCNGGAMGLGMPLTRFGIFEVAKGPCQFLWEIHHALYDGFSLPLFLKEAEHIYFNELSQALEPMTAFIKYIMDRDKTAERDFWQRAFANTQDSHFPPPKAAYHPRPDCQMHLTISDLDWGCSDFTPATIIRATWSVITANGAGSNEALFGVTVTGRQAPVPGIELIAGPTIATVPIRLILDWDSSFNQLLNAVQRQAVDMIPFEQTGLQRIARFGEETALGCGFQNLLVIQPADEGDSEYSSGFLSEFTEAQNETQWQHFSTYSIVIECQLESGGAHLRIGYDSSIIGQQQMERIAHKFEYTLGQLSDGKRGNQILRILADDQWNMDRIWTWNAVVPKPTEACIHDLILQRVQENPSAPAVCAWDGELTYGQLDHLSTSLAHQLSEKVVAKTVVPLVFEKSMFMPIAALAVMKAGGACVALDIKQPQERLRAISAQTNSSIILSSQKNESLARQVGANKKEVLIVGTNLSLPAPVRSKLPPVSPSDNLYVVFTSGSTGTPKGVIITHRNFCSAITYQQKALGFSNTSRVLDFASYAFDAVWCNLLHALTVGGTLCIPSQAERESDISGCLDTYNITSVDLTPSVARIVGQKALSRLTTLILGGEAVLLGDAYLADDKTDIINVYGPAECTPTVAFSKVTADNVGIGYGAGVCTWVVETDNPESLASIGSTGELYIEGPLVGEGYLNDPKKTASSFVDDPAWLLRGVLERPGLPGRPGRRGRLYRTGDLVRYKEDGSLVFVGRKDTQVKIRGQRVELGEVEQHVLDTLCPLVAEGAKLANVQIVAETIQPKGATNAILVAFVALEYGGDKNITEELHAVAVREVTETLTNRLMDKLPIYMVPTAFISIPKLPITATGKTDRKQLQVIGKSVYLQYRSAPHKNESTESLSELETILQQVWMSVLNLSSQEASVNKLFTRLGGDSISAMQVVSRSRLHNIAFTVSDLLKAGTIRNLAAHCKIISRHALVEKEEQLVQEDTATGGAFEISPIQQMFFDAYPEGLNHFNQSFVLELSKAIPTVTLRSALQALLQRHSMLRARFHKDPDSDLWMQTVAEVDDTQSFAFAEHLVAHRGKVTEIGQLRQESLDIQRGPVFACDIFIIPDGSRVLVLSAHHLVIDLVSWRIVWNDIEEFVTHGRLLSKPTASFRRWCRHQARIGRNLSPLSVLPYSIPEPQLSFWGLPLSDNTLANCETYTDIFDEDITKALFGGSNESLRTEPMDIIIGAMVHSFLHTFPERAAPVVWIEGHGREQSDELPFDMSETVGWFTTMYPLPVPIELESSVIDAIRIAKDTRRKVPGKGQPYFACRYHSESGREAFQGHDVVELIFNFTGRYQQLETEEGLFTRPQYFHDEEHHIVEVSESTHRFTMIEINADVEEGLLGVSFHIHKNMKHQDRLRKWTETFFHTLESATKDLLRLVPTFTLDDLSLLPLSYNGLDTLLKEQLPSMGIKAEDIADIYPCSPLQEGILLSSQKETASYATFSVWQCIPSDGIATISTSRLEAAWKTVVKRHTILQSVFSLHPEGNGFIQIVLPASNIKVTHIAVEQGSPTAILDRLKRPAFAANEPEHTFTICQSGTSEVACRLDASHSLIDASSMSILVQDIASAYDSCDLPLAPPFSDMIRYINSISRAQRLASWTKLLDGVEPCEFPTSSQNPKQAGSKSHSDLSILSNLVYGVGDFCKKIGITRSVFLQVAWAMALSQLTGKHEVCFGYLASGRDSLVDGIDTMVGPLANLLISRIDLRAPAEQVLKTTAEKSIEHLSIQHASLAEIQHELGLSGRRLFNTCLSIREADKLKGSEKRSLSFESNNGEDPHEYDLSLSASIDGDNMDIIMEFRESYVSQHVARDASTVLTKAIQYLMETDIDDIDILASEESLISSFFRHTVGADEQLTKEFWKTHFSGIQGSHFPPPKVPKYEPQPDREVSLSIQGLNWGSRGYFSTATVLGAAWSILTTRILGSNEALFGAMVTDHKAVVPIRILLDSEASIAEFLRKVQLQAAKTAQFQRTSLQIVRSINEETSLGCDFQSVLYMVDHPANEVGGQHSVLTDKTSEEWKQSFDSYAMVVECQLQANGANLHIRFDSDVVGELQVTRIGHQLEHVLRQLLNVGLQEQKLRDLTAVSPRDVKDIWTWNATLPEPVQACVHELIIQKAREQPLAPAIDSWDGSVTYRQLYEMSTCLAYELVNSGVGPGTIVPLCFEKSMWMPVAALAVMQAGAAAVALDSSSQPEERIRAITMQVKAKIILSSVANEALTHRLGINEVVVVGPDQLLVPTFSLTYKTLSPLIGQTPRLPTISPSDILYVIFTSGSTGVPKGVKILHNNMCSAIAYQRDALGYTNSSRVLDFSSYAFDVFWSNLLNTLTSGACLCIPSTAERQDNLSRCLEKYKITLADFTPSIARHTTGLASLTTLVLGGEVVLPTDIYLAGPKTQVRSAYGPAECTPTATILNLSDVSNVGLGRGAGVCTWVIEPDNPESLAPIGAVGELWIEGPLVGDGYLDDPAKTAVSLVDDPAWLVQGVLRRPGVPGLPGRRGRLYRTGDLVRYREDGSLLFIGRKDTQVKIRGQRVELDEVEHHVRQAIGGNHVQVVAETIQPRGTESIILAAFVDLGSAGEDHDSEVKQATVGVSDRLAEILPPFMIPTIYIPLQKVPRVATGKIDRQKLRAIGSSLTPKDLATLSRLDGERRAPRSDIERLIQGLWAEVLKIDSASISIEDSFFRMGGDSIGAMRLVGMARQKGLSLTVRDIFRNPILRDLAALYT